MQELKKDIELIAQVAPSLTVLELAEKWDVERDVMYRFLYAHDIQFKRIRRGRPQNEKLPTDVIEQLSSGLSVKSIARNLGLNEGQVYHSVRKQGKSIIENRRQKKAEKVEKIMRYMKENRFVFSDKRETCFSAAAKKVYPDMLKSEICSLRRHCKIKKAANK